MKNPLRITVEVAEEGPPHDTAERTESFPAMDVAHMEEAVREWVADAVGSAVHEVLTGEAPRPIDATTGEGETP